MSTDQTVYQSLPTPGTANKRWEAGPEWRPKVGVSVFILRPKANSGDSLEFIAGVRKGSHGAGTLALPGGHMEFKESIEETGAWEIFEETGLYIKNVKFMTIANDVFEVERKHYITVFVTAEIDEEKTVRGRKYEQQKAMEANDTEHKLMGWKDDGARQEPLLLEPKKCEGWEWIEWKDILEWYKNGERELFLPFPNLIKQRPGVEPLLN